MHDNRLDHYTDRALTDRELQQLRWKEAAGEFKSFPVICINASGQELALKFGATYEVTGECGDCWHLTVTNDIPHLDFAKRRFVTPDQWSAWLDARAAYHMEEAQKYIALYNAEAPDGRF